MSERRWLMAVAVGGFAAATALGWAGNTIWMLPIIGASLIFLAFVPAVILMREQRR